MLTLRPQQRHYKEALACTMLSHRNIVPFRAAYTTSKHPLALVYDFMEHRRLGEYLSGNADIGRVRLVRPAFFSPYRSSDPFDRSSRI